MAHFTTIDFKEFLKHCCGGSLHKAAELTGFPYELCERYAAGEEPSMYHHMVLAMFIGTPAGPAGNSSE